MAVTSASIWSLPDGTDYPNGLSKRPVMKVGWVGGTGPFDVLHEWDTVNTFDSGALITDNNTGVTGDTDDGVPPSDLSVGTWYYQVTITDTDDDQNEKQRVTFSEEATGDTWRLSYNSNATGDLAYNISFAALETALEGLTGITAVTVTGTVGQVYDIEFTDPALTDMLALVVDDDSLTPSAIVITVTEETKGSAAADQTYPSSDHTIVMFESYDTPSYLSLYKNIVPGWDTDEVDDAGAQPRFLGLNTNVIPGFDRDEVDDRIEQPRHLYLYKNITTDQPCPYVERITPLVVSQGSALLIKGDSFGAAASTYQTEVRLYENQDLSGSYVVLGTTSWADNEISATVPAAGETGWIVLVQTNGSATCSGSTPKLITIELSVPDPDAGWWLRTANRLNVTDAEHTVLPGNNVKTSFRKIMNAIGSGQVEIPLGDPIINEFIDPVTRKGVLVQSWIDDQMRYGWFAETMSHDYSEEGDAVVVIAGRGMEVVSLWNKILPHDYPASPTRNPTWVYGSNENFVQNPGFDDAADNPILSNPGGEDGNDDDGNAEGWSKIGDDVNSIIAIQDAVAAMTDDWYIEVDANKNHSGMQQSITVVPNRVYHVRAYVKDPTASGMRVTLRTNGADDLTATGTYANNYEWENGIYAELGNVARNAAANGCPGGSTDGTWQVLDVEVKTGDEQTSLVIAVQDDHHTSCTGDVHVPFMVDSVEIEGWGLGLDPWKAYQPAKHASNSFRLQSTKTYDGSTYGLYLNPLSTWAGIEQVMQVNPLTKYTMSLWMWTDLLHGDDTWKLEAHENDGLDSWIGTPEEKVPNDEGWTQYQIVFTTDATIEELVLRFVYSGPNNPSPAYVDSISVVPGEPPSTAGVILNAILDKMDEHGKLEFLTRTFTDESDSLGQAWPSPLSLDLQPSESLYDVLSRLVALGHEWEIVPTQFRAGGNTGFELNVYTARPFNPITGVGQNFVGEPDGPVIMPSDATIGGRILKSAFNINSVMAIGEDGIWARVVQNPWLDADMPSGDPAAHGYEDSFGVIEDVISVSASDPTTIAQFAEARLAEEKDRERALQLDMQRSATFRPFLHINVGDSLFVDMPPNDADPPVSDGEGGFTRSYPKRIRSIQADLAGEGSEITFQVDIDRVIYEDQLAWNAMIAQLAERSPAGNTGQGTGSVSGAGGAVSVLVDGGGTGVITPHTHSLKSTDITDKALVGDVSGTIPGPVSVNALRGRPVSRTIPADTGGDVVMIFDRVLLTWVPLEKTFSGGVSDLDDLDDVNAGTPGDTEVLSWDNATSKWVPVVRPTDGIDGDDGAPGADGDDGVGVPAGGTVGQVLAKVDATDYNTEWANAGGVYTESISFSQAGALSAGTGTMRLYTPVGRTIVDVTAAVGVASTSGVVTFDVHKDGTTIFTTQTDRPEVAASGYVSDTETPAVTAWASGSYLTVDIDAAGTGAEDAVVTIRFQEA